MGGGLPVKPEGWPIYQYTDRRLADSWIAAMRKELGLGSVAAESGASTTAASGSVTPSVIAMPDASPPALKRDAGSATNDRRTRPPQITVWGAIVLLVGIVIGAVAWLRIRRSA